MTGTGGGRTRIQAPGDSSWQHQAAGYHRFFSQFTTPVTGPLLDAARVTAGAMLDEERDSFGGTYPDHGCLMCWEDGRQLHPDTITRQFNRLVDLAGVRRIRLHDVCHTGPRLRHQQQDSDGPDRPCKRDRHPADLHAPLDGPGP